MLDWLQNVVNEIDVAKFKIHDLEGNLRRNRR